MSQRSAALRILEEMTKAAKGNYYKHGWASYMRREDVEAVALAMLEPTERVMYHRVIREASDG